MIHNVNKNVDGLHEILLTDQEMPIFISVLAVALEAAHDKGDQPVIKLLSAWLGEIRRVD